MRNHSLGNGPAPVLVQLGVALAGMTLVPVDPRSRSAEVEHALRLSGAVLAIAAEEEVGGNPVADLCAAAEGVELLTVGPRWRDSLPWGTPGELSVVGPESLAQVQFTSGTTGRAQGVRITHAGMVATGVAFADRLGPTAGRVWCIDAEGWLHTGDLAEMSPAGHCRVVGRLEDMLKTGGENVSPVEVEEVPSRTPPWPRPPWWVRRIRGGGSWWWPSSSRRPLLMCRWPSSRPGVGNGCPRSRFLAAGTWSTSCR